MFQIKIFEDLDGKGVKQTGSYESPDQASCQLNWPGMTDGERKAGSYAIFVNPEGKQLNRKDW